MDLRRGWLAAGAAVLLVASAAASVAGCRSKVAGLGVNLEIDHRKLSNGLQVVMVENKNVPAVSYQTWLRVGSVDERPGITGISHLFEHMMFKGTPKYAHKEFFRRLEAKGAEVNAFTTRDYTVYYEVAAPELLPQVIDMEADRLANIEFDAESLDRERQVVLEERRMRTDNSPGGKMQEALWQLAYRVHPYQWPVIGYPTDLLALNVEKVREYFKKHYLPSNATIVIVGNFDSDQVFGMIEKAYGAIPKAPRPKREIRKEPEQKEERRFVMYDQVASERFLQGYHVTAADEEDTHALDVLASILFEGRSSRGHRLLVEDKDVVLGISGAAFTPTYPGLFIIQGAMKGNLETDVAERLLEQLFREVQEQGVTEDEIRIAVKQLTVQLVDSVRTPQGLGQLIGTVMTVFGDPQRFVEDLAKYTKVTQADVKRVAEKYLHPNNRSVVVLKPAAKRGPK